MGRMHVLIELEMASFEKTARCAGGAVGRSRARRVGAGVGRLGRGSCGAAAACTWYSTHVGSSSRLVSIGITKRRMRSIVEMHAAAAIVDP